MGGSKKSAIHLDLDLESLMTAFPSEDVHRIIDELGKREKRRRKLPSGFVVYHGIALGLMVSTGAKEVLRHLLDKVRDRFWIAGRSVASEAAITKARKRLGAEPIRRLFEDLAKPVGKKTTKGCWFRGRRVVSLDGSTLHLQDSEANDRAYGRPPTSGRDPAWPLIRFVMLIENGTHVPFAAKMDGWRTSENALGAAIVGNLRAGMVCLADRLFYSYDLWSQAVTTGADLLWRVQKKIRLPRRKTFSDGSYLSQVCPPVSGPKHRKAPPIPVRVIEYTTKVKGTVNQFRVITTILNPRSASALELARLYNERWSFEGALREMKTFLRGRKTLLRSRIPELVEQDFYGLLLAYYGVRSVMHDVARQEQIEPQELSFVHALNVIVRRLPEAVSFSPSGLAALP
jgi:hypothetical protein